MGAADVSKVLFADFLRSFLRGVTDLLRGIANFGCCTGYRVGANFTLLHELIGKIAAHHEHEQQQRHHEARATAA